MKVRGTERSSLAGSNTSYHSIVGRASHTQPVKIDRRKRSLVNPKSIDDEIGIVFSRAEENLRFNKQLQLKNR